MIMAEVVCSSSCDPRHPPANVLDERMGNFWITTGAFPQVVVLKLQNNRNNDAPVDIERIKTFSANVAKLVVESSSSPKPEAFERLFETELQPGRNRLQTEVHQVSTSAVYLKFVILKAHDDFATINSIVLS